MGLVSFFYVSFLFVVAPFWKLKFFVFVSLFFSVTAVDLEGKSLQYLYNITTTTGLNP